MNTRTTQNIQLAGLLLAAGGFMVGNPNLQAVGVITTMAGSAVRVAQDRSILDATALGSAAYAVYSGNGYAMAASMLLATLSALQPAERQGPSFGEMLLR